MVGGGDKSILEALALFNKDQNQKVPVKLNRAQRRARAKMIRKKKKG